MAEIATIARPYAEALFKAQGVSDRAALAQELQALGAVAADPAMRSFADNPKVTSEQVFDLLTSIAARDSSAGHGGAPLSAPARNLLRTVIENGRLAAMPEIAEQFHQLVNGQSGTSDALVESAFPMEGPQLDAVVRALEKRFKRRLDARVVVDPALIGGIRVVVGDEVLDTSVRARLEQMRLALAA
ncbi:MAG TPA: F0F1 ATP synthase subunit delta [Caldimonas sp.]|nr:F0F1 ATP synthase subunit delta [Caldimonas sp.]